MSRTPVLTTLTLLVLLMPGAASWACESTTPSPDLQLGSSLRASYLELYAPFETSLGTRVMPEKEFGFEFTVVLVSRSGVARPPEFDAELSTIEKSLQMYLMEDAIGRHGVEKRGAALDAAVRVPIQLTRVEPDDPAFWATWRVRPDFSALPGPASQVFPTFSLGTDALREYMDAGSATPILAGRDYRQVDIAPARSDAERLARELSDMMMAEEAGNWPSLLAHADTLIALDANAVLGHAFKARALSELGQQSAAGASMATATSLLASGTDTQLLASPTPNLSGRVENIMSRELCPVLARVVPLPEPDPACSRAAWLSLGW